MVIELADFLGKDGRRKVSLAVLAHFKHAILTVIKRAPDIEDISWHDAVLHKVSSLILTLRELLN